MKNLSKAVLLIAVIWSGFYFGHPLTECILTVKKSTDYAIAYVLISAMIICVDIIAGLAAVSAHTAIIKPLGESIENLIEKIRIELKKENSK